MNDWIELHVRQFWRRPPKVDDLYPAWLEMRACVRREFDALPEPPDVTALAMQFDAELVPERDDIIDPETGEVSRARDEELAELDRAAEALRARVMRGAIKDACFLGTRPEEPRNYRLETAAIESDDFGVYVDWLLANGDPRSEWLGLAQHPGKWSTVVDRAQADALLPFAEVGTVQATWRRGFVETVRIEATRADEEAGVFVVPLIEAVLALPVMRFARQCTIFLPSGHEAERAIHYALRNVGVREAMRHLILETNLEEEMHSWTEAGDLEATCAQFPRLETLSLCGGNFVLRHFPDGLRELSLRSPTPPSNLIDQLVQNAFANLDVLELWLGDCDPLELLRHPMPKLRSLSLANHSGADQTCRRLPTTPLLAQLRSLSLAGGTMTDTGATALIENASAFAHLDVIDVAENYITSEAFARLIAALPQTRGQDQREIDGDRYVATTE